MKKRNGILMMSLLMMGSVVHADICSDIKLTYASKITALQREINAALERTTSSAEQAALLESFTMQKELLTMEMDATLLASGCTGDVVTPPSDNPTTPPTEDPGTNAPGDGGGTTPPPPGDGGGTTPPPGGGTDTPPLMGCPEKVEAFHADIEMKKNSGMSKSELVHYMNSKKAEIKECTNWGPVRSRVNH
jgi:hypothetical protein